MDARQLRTVAVRTVGGTNEEQFCGCEQQMGSAFGPERHHSNYSVLEKTGVLYKNAVGTHVIIVEEVVPVRVFGKVWVIFRWPKINRCTLSI